MPLAKHLSANYQHCCKVYFRRLQTELWMVWRISFRPQYKRASGLLSTMCRSCWLGLASIVSRPWQGLIYFHPSYSFLRRYRGLRTRVLRKLRTSIKNEERMDTDLQCSGCGQGLKSFWNSRAMFCVTHRPYIRAGFFAKACERSRLSMSHVVRSITRRSDALIRAQHSYSDQCLYIQVIRDHTMLHFDTVEL